MVIADVVLLTKFSSLAAMESHNVKITITLLLCYDTYNCISLLRKFTMLIYPQDVGRLFTISVMPSQITSNSMVCTTICLSQDKKNLSKSVLPTLCEGNPPVTGGFAHKGPVMRKAAKWLIHVWFFVPLLTCIKFNFIVRDILDETNNNMPWCLKIVLLRAIDLCCIYVHGCIYFHELILSALYL